MRLEQRETPGTHSYANSKHSPDSCQINIKLHAKSLITSAPLTKYIMSSF